MNEILKSGSAIFLAALLCGCGSMAGSQPASEGISTTKSTDDTLSLTDYERYEHSVLGVSTDEILRDRARAKSVGAKY